MSVVHCCWSTRTNVQCISNSLWIPFLSAGWYEQSLCLYQMQVSIHLFSECPPPVLHSKFTGSKSWENIFGRQIQLMYRDNLLIYQLHSLPVSPFMVDCWQLVERWTQGNAPQLFTCTIQLPTPGKSCHMTTGQSSCFTSVLPMNQLMIVGGLTDGFITAGTVEISSICN